MCIRDRTLTRSGENHHFLCVLSKQIRIYLYSINKNKNTNFRSKESSDFKKVDKTLLHNTVYQATSKRQKLLAYQNITTYLFISKGRQNKKRQSRGKRQTTTKKTENKTYLNKLSHRLAEPYNSSNGCLNTILPVSYTHLDVYKRQG